MIRDPKVRVVSKGHVAVCDRTGEPIFGSKAETTLEAIRNLRKVLDGLAKDAKEG